MNSLENQTADWCLLEDDPGELVSSLAVVAGKLLELNKARGNVHVI